MKMLNGNVLVTEQNTGEDQTESGLFIPKQPKSYKIVKVVEQDSESITAVDDELYVSINSGTEIEVDNKKYLIINVREIILIL